jgi:HEAT repeat protein
VAFLKAFFAILKCALVRSREGLVRLLKDPNPYVRQIAARRLAFRGEKEAVEPLIGALKDEFERVRSWAVLGLKKAKDSRGVIPLIDRLKDASSNVRADAALALSVFQAPVAVASLIELLKDSDRLVRWATALSLGVHRDTRAVEPLKIMRDAEPQITNQRPDRAGMDKLRDAVVKALVGGGEVRDVLGSFFGNPRLAAEIALTTLSTEQSPEARSSR